MPITPTDRTWIEDNLKWLFEQFGHEAFLRNELVKDAHEYFPYKLKEGETRPLEVLAAKMCGEMNISFEEVRLDIFFRENHNGGSFALGYYQNLIDLKDGKTTPAIMLNLSPISNKAGIIATLAHELAHIKLLGENRISAAEADHEYLTDLCTLFWGFGLLEANQAFSTQTDYHPDSPSISVSSVSKSGYLPLEMWAYALALYCHLKEIAGADLLPYLSREMQVQFAASLQWIHQQGSPLDMHMLNRPGIVPDPRGRNLLPADVQQKLQILDQAILNKSFPQAWLDRARLNKRYGLLSPTLQDLHHLLQTNQLRDEALLLRADIALEMGALEAAGEDLEKLSPQARKWPESIYMDALYHWHLQDHEHAEALLKQCLAQDANHAKANWAFGVSLFMRKELDKALQHFNLAIQRNPLKPHFWTDRAKVHLWNGDTKAALADLHTALGIDKNQAEAYVGRGILRRKEKRFEAAIQDFDTALRLSYYYTAADWHKRVTEQLMTEDIWIAVGNFDTLEEAFPIRQQMLERGIKHRFGDQQTVNMTASTYISKWLYVRDDRVEEAMDILTEGWW